MPLIIAPAPTTTIQTGNNGLEIAYPKIDTWIRGENHSIRFHVFNVSNGVIMTNISANCIFDFYNITGKAILRVAPLNFGSIAGGLCTNCFWTDINSSYLMTMGIRSYLIRCQTYDNTLGGFVSVPIVINESGVPDPDGFVIVLYSLFFMITIFSFSYLTISNLGHYIKLDFDFLDLAWNFGIYFVLVGGYMLELNYLMNPQVESFLLLFIEIGAFTQIFIPAIMLIVSMIAGTGIRKKLWSAPLPRHRRFEI